MRVVFMGTPDFAVPSLHQLIENGYNVVGIVTQPDKPTGRKQVLAKSPVKMLAEGLNIEVFQPLRIRNKEAIDYVLSWNPEIIITAAYGQILPIELLETPKYKAINVHASLLPKYRGAAPIHKSIIDGEIETGVTIMYMVKELDAGDIISQAKIAIKIDDSVGTLTDKLSEVGSKLLLETLKMIELGNIKTLSQDNTKATFAPTLKREDELIIWDKTSMEIYNQIRGLNPWPVAYTFFRNEIFKIWWAEPVEYKHQELPGTITKVDKDKLFIATKNGALNLKEVQPAGKRKMDILSFLQGVKITLGEKMGE